ncbi:MAG: tol-pal system protein YbgF [Alphaproteobacteria bacterium]|nr:tol-pal system protein YbgF [Alphaproteobacteria bacterium]
MARGYCAFSDQKAWSIPGLLCLLLLICLVVMPGAAWAQSDREMNNRLNRMENDIQTLSRALYKGEQPPAGAISPGVSANAADMEVRLQRMEADLQEMRGRVEEQSHEIRQLRDQLERATGDMELRLNELEGRGGASNSRSGSGDHGYVNDVPNQERAFEGAPAESQDEGYRWGTSGAARGADSSSGSTSRSLPSSDDAAMAYENAFAMIKSGDFDSARSGFEDFLKRYPDHVLAGNAKYWLGEAYYAKGKYEDSARIFAEGYKEYPKGSKAADNLLKLGLSLHALGHKDDACIALRQLQNENIAGAAPVIRRAGQEMTRIGC